MSDFWSELLISQTPCPINESDTFLYPIVNRQVLSIKGPDSAKFMQGQFSCHLDDVTEQTYRPGACCTAKGRLVSNFNLCQIQPHEYLLSLHHSITQSTQNHLKKYMVFFKAKMEQQETVLTGIKGADAQQILQTVFKACPQQDFDQQVIEQGLIMKLPFEAGFEIWLQPEHAQEAIQTLLSKCKLTHQEAWPLNLVQHGQAQLTQDSTDKFIPQMLNLGQTGAISFNKGCYTGQEIVARMQYLGKLKRHLYRAVIKDKEALQIGDGIFTPGHDNPVGELVNIAVNGETCEALLVIEDKYLQNPLSLKSVGGPQIELLSLPYEIIVKQE